MSTAGSRVTRERAQEVDAPHVSEKPVRVWRSPQLDVVHQRAVCQPCQALLLALVSSLTACEDRTATQLIVRIHADDTVRSIATLVDVEVFGDDGNKACCDTPFPIADLPIEVPIAPDGSEHARVVARLRGPTRAGELRARGSIEAQARFSLGELRYVDMAFDAACMEIDCEQGRTCFEGTCRSSCVEPKRDESDRSAVPSGNACERCERAASHPIEVAHDACGDRCIDGEPHPLGTAQSVALSEFHSCATTTLEQNARIMCWGRCGGPLMGCRQTVGFDVEGCSLSWPEPILIDGQALDPDGNPETGFRSLSVGLLHGCAVGDSGHLYCWGDNALGALFGRTRQPRKQATCHSTRNATRRHVHSKGCRRGERGAVGR